MIELRATSYSVTTSAFIINAAPLCICNDSITELHNCEKFKLVLCKEFPVMDTVVPVYINLDNINYPVQDVIGNSLMSDRVHSHCVYCTVFGTNPAHFKLLTCTGRSQATNISL